MYLFGVSVLPCRSERHRLHANFLRAERFSAPFGIREKHLPELDNQAVGNRPAGQRFKRPFWDGNRAERRIRLQIDIRHPPIPEDRVVHRHIGFVTSGSTDAFGAPKDTRPLQERWTKRHHAEAQDDNNRLFRDNWILP